MSDPRSEEAPHGAFSVPELVRDIRRNVIAPALALPLHLKRPEQIVAFVELWWTAGKVPLPRQVKLGLSEALRRMPAQALLNCHRGANVSLGDVLMLVRARPKNKEQAEVFKTLVGRRAK